MSLVIESPEAAQSKVRKAGAQWGVKALHPRNRQQNPHLAEGERRVSHPHMQQQIAQLCLCLSLWFWATHTLKGDFRMRTAKGIALPKVITKRKPLRRMVLISRTVEVSTYNEQINTK